MIKRFLLLAGLCILLGVATSVFGAEPKLAPWITREGAVAMLVESKPEWKAKLTEARAHPEPMPIFTDTDGDEWYIPYLEVAFEEGLIEATDFHREFRPGELLREGEAITLAVRYKANGDQAQLPQEEPDHPLSIPLHVQKGYDMGLKFPEPFKSWDVIRRGAWYDLIASAGMKNPAGVVLVIPPKTAPTTAAVVQPLPVTGPLDPVLQQPVAVQPIFPVQQPVVQPATGFKPADPMLQPTTSLPSYMPAQSQPAYSQLAYSQPTSQPAVSVPNQPAVSQPTSNPNNGDGDNVDPNNSYFAIAIPSLGITDLKITHPNDVASQVGLLAPLQTGVGHLFSYPGQGGTTLIYGHSSSVQTDLSEYTKIFRQINKLKPGDKVYIAYQGKTHEYEVTFSQTVAASDFSAYQQQNGEELILYTCWPPDDVKQRYLVHAKPV